MQEIKRRGPAVGPPFMSNDVQGEEMQMRLPVQQKAEQDVTTIRAPYVRNLDENTKSSSGNSV